MADADNILKELLENICHENHWKDYTIKIEDINHTGRNFTATLYFVDISLPEKEVKLFAKVARTNDNLRAIMDVPRLFYLETYFYSKLTKIYDDLQTKHCLMDDDKLAYAKFYGCNTKEYEETVVLENLMASGYKTNNRFTTVDWDYAAASVEALAKFHALSFAFQKSDPEEYEKVIEELPCIIAWDNLGDDQLNLLSEMARNKTALIKNTDYKKRVDVLLQKLGRDFLVKFRHSIKTRVIVHSDYRSCNVLSKKQGSKLHAIPVDYQTIHTGNPISDLIHFEALGTDSAFRAEYHDRLVEHYYSELVKALQRLDVDPTEAYPREVFDEELELTLPYAIIVGIVVLPIVLAEADEAPKVEGDGVGLESFLIPNTDVFTELFNGIVEDCVRWGSI